MPKVAKWRRKRACRPKTKSGCLTCRIRRVKCDETRPACLRCTSTRRVCDGYSHAQPTTWSPRTDIVPVGTAYPSFEVQHSSEAQKSFAFFVKRTSPQLAGFFGSDFWERLVLQAAYHEPAVRHAVVAIGSLHDLLQRQLAPTDANSAFALEQYNLAIRELLSPISRKGKQGVDVCLITCILFTCLENMQGHHAAAGAHIHGGVKLLHETAFYQQTRIVHHERLGSKNLIDSYAPVDTLAGVFAGLNPELTVTTDASTLERSGEFSKTAHDGAPFSFSSIEEAKKVYEHGFRMLAGRSPARLSGDSSESHTTVEAHATDCSLLFSKFLVALDELTISTSASSRARECVAIAVLRLHLLNNYVFFHIEHLPPQYRRRRNEFTPQMKEMLALGKYVTSYISTSDDLGGNSTSYCLDMGIIIPLYTVASQCQDLQTRRDAIALLRSTPRQEGLWNSALVANAAERIMEIEESTEEIAHTRLDSGEHRRRSSSSVRPLLELDAKGGRLKYTQQESEEDFYEEVIEEVFSW